MRYVQRGAEPPELAEYKAAANENWTPRYDDFHAKASVVVTFAREQGYLCGYCGSPIGARRGDCHIEHVVPQSVDRNRELDHTNMLASCQGSDAAPPVPEHCGAARGNQPLAVTPFMRDCGSFFAFSSDGRVRAVEDPARKPRGEETIDVLRLNVPRLVAARAAAIDGALDGLEAESADAWLAEAATYDRPSADGHLAPYCFAIQHVLRRFA